VLTGSLTRKAIDYAINQWGFLTGYCDDGHLHISNALAENAIRPFAVGRKAWLFADTTRGAHASATMYSLIETAKANDLEPRSYLLHVLERIGAADTVEQLEALLPWNVQICRVLKKLWPRILRASRRIYRRLRAETRLTFDDQPTQRIALIAKGSESASKGNLSR
jgi:transposase